VSNQIELTLPINPAYVSAARLTASSIASRLGFGIEEIEDIKTAVSEACTLIIEKIACKNKNSFKLIFKPESNSVDITFLITGDIKNTQEFDQETSMIMIKALMDKIEIKPKENGILILLTKNHNTVVF